jgi:hypothetical protein
MDEILLSRLMSISASFRARLADSSATLLVVFIARHTIQGFFGARKNQRVIVTTLGIPTKRVPHGAHLFKLSFRELIHAGIVGIIHAVNGMMMR